MTTPATQVPAWHEEGRRAAGVLDPHAAVLVIGRDPEVAAWVAIGMARAQAAQRRVAVGDLVGEVAPLQALVGDDDDPHGITDSFLYGVSLNRIARPVAGADNLFVLPSGSEEVAVTDILASDRWRRLAGGFREVGALLLLVARADAPGLDVLATMVDGVVVAGDAAGALPDAPPPLAVVAPVSTRRARGGSPATEPALGAALAAFAAEAAPAAPAAPAVRNPYAPRDPYDDPAPATVGAPAGADAASERAARLRQERLAHSAALAAGSEPVAAGRRMPDWQRWTLVGVWGAVAATGWWAWSRLRAPATDAPAAVAPAVAGAPVDSAGATDTVARARAADSLARLAAARDSARRDSVRQARTPVTLSALTVANPADSGAAAAYAVYLQSSNTPEGAVLDARTMETLPPAALTPLLERGAPWYRLLVGAYRTRAEADRLLADLRRRDVMGGGSGSIVRAPYALRVAERVAAADVPQRVLALTGKNVPVYPLSNGDGTVSLYAGAFETPEQAAYLARNLQAAGVQPVLVYRTGRSL